MMANTLVIRPPGVAETPRASQPQHLAGRVSQHDRHPAMTDVHEKEIEAVLKLDGEARFKRFIEVVVDCEQAWGLWADGWALLEDDSGVRVFPLWPARKYAELCRGPDWANHKAVPIALDDLLNALLPKLREQGVLAGVFPTPSGRGVTPSLDILETELRKELERYD